MPTLSELFAREARLLQQQKELQGLRKEVDSLQTQNERLRQAMRRCLTCEYRLEVVGVRGESRSQPS